MELFDELGAFVCFVEDNVKDVCPVLELKLQVLLQCIVLGLISLVLRQFDANLIQKDFLLSYRFVHERIGTG